MSERLRALTSDLVAGLVVALVALPLCLGIAHASGAPLLAGLVSGILAGLLVSWLSGSQTSVSGPAAGLTAVVLSQIQQVGTFEAFLVAVIVGGVVQVGMGLCRLGVLSLFVPSTIIKGLLAAIGVILILKQIPHAIGHDPDFEGDFAFKQEDHLNTFTEISEALTKIHPGAAFVGIVSIGFLILWEKSRLRKSVIPAPLIVAIFGVLAKLFFDRIGQGWSIESTHLVQVPVVEHLGAWRDTLHFPDFSQAMRPGVYVAGVTIAIVASLETLLNLDATDKLDPKKRDSPPNRELIAQGVGNICAGLLGGLPMTSVIVRSSVNINAGARSRRSAFFHGLFLLFSILFVPKLLNLLPLSALAAILVTTGLKLAPLSLVRKMWKEGAAQFIPFATTVLAIVFTDLLLGILIGLGVSALFILRSNFKRPFLAAEERYVGGDVVRFRLADQLSFLNKAALVQALHSVPERSQIVLDARSTDYIDADILEFIKEFRDQIAPAKQIHLTLMGFSERFQIDDQVEHVDVTTSEARATLTPADVLRTLREGNQRFVRDRRLQRGAVSQINLTAQGQFPIAVTLSCIDSRTSVELLFDQGLGDVFSIRIAGNVADDKVLASIEYATLVAGAKLIVVLGHTSCGAVTAACNAALAVGGLPVADCPHLPSITDLIGQAIDVELDPERPSQPLDPVFIDQVARRSVELTMEFIRRECPTIIERVDEGSIGLLGGMYDVRTGSVRFFGDEALIRESEGERELEPLTI
jgi:carbonic anhydrase